MGKYNLWWAECKMFVMLKHVIYIVTVALKGQFINHG